MSASSVHVAAQRQRPAWAALAERHPDLVVLREHGLEVGPFVVDLSGALTRPMSLLPEGTVSFGWSDAIAPEAHVLLQDGRPGTVLFTTDTGRLGVLGDDLDSLLDDFTRSLVEVLDDPDPDLDVEDEDEDLREGVLAARFPALRAGTSYGDVPAPRRADLLPLADDPVLAAAVATAGAAYGRGLPPDPERTLVVDLRGARGLVADLTGLQTSPDPAWCALDPSGSVLTWRIEAVAVSSGR